MLQLNHLGQTSLHLLLLNSSMPKVLQSIAPTLTLSFLQLASCDNALGIHKRLNMAIIH